MYNNSDFIVIIIIVIVNIMLHNVIIPKQLIVW